MCHPRRLLIGLAALAAAAVAAAQPAARGPAGMAAAGAPVLAAEPDDPVEDPFPLVRIRVTDAQFADAAKTFAPGPLVRTSRAAFEEKVRAAGRAVRAARAAPRIASARYTAAPSGAALAGTAEWAVTHAGQGPAVLPLDPLKVALRDAAWADGTPAVLGAFAEAGVGVWVPGPGRHVLRAKWSAAGVGPAGERAFDLRFPPCPASLLDLDLPAGRTPSAPDALVTGPAPGAAGAAKWAVRFGDKGAVALTLRGPADAPAGPVVYAVAARYDLGQADVSAAFEFDLRAARGTATGWAFTPSPGLRVTDVTGPNRAAWAVDPKTGELRVTLRQPAPASRLVVAAAAPLGAGTTPLPTLRPVSGLPTDERAEVRLPPGLDLGAWESGDFRVADAAPAGDGGRVLTLAGTLLPAGSTAAARRPPAVRVAYTGPRFATTEAVAWRVEAGRAYLTARVRIAVRRGPLFRVAVQPPPGFALDRAAADPPDLLAFAGAGTGGALTVEFARPLHAGQAADVTLELRGLPLPAGPVARLPFPAVGVSGASERDGAVALDPGPGWDAFPVVPPDAAGDAPVLRYRGREPAGELLLAAVRPAFASSVETRFDFSGGRLSATSVVKVDVSAGLVGGAAVFEPGPPVPGRTWKVADGSNTVAAATPARLGDLPGALALLGRPGGFGAVAAAAAGLTAEPGTHWLVRFTRPVEDGVALETAAELGADLSHADAARRAADWAAGRAGLVVRGAAARTARADLPPALGGATPAAPAAGPPGEWSVGDVSVLTVCTTGDQTVTLGGVVEHRGGRRLPVTLPAGARATAAVVGGAAVDPVALGGTDLGLPVPAGGAPVRFELRYKLPRVEAGAGWTVESPVPGVAGQTGGVRRVWAFGPGVAPAAPAGVRAATAGAPPTVPAGFAWTDHAGEAVTVLPDRTSIPAGLALAALAGGLGWFAARRASTWAGFAVLLLAGLAGAAVLAGPPAWGRVGWPVVAVGLPAAAAVVVARGRAPAVAAGVLAFAVAGTAQPPAPDVVLVVSGPTGDAVFVPPGLLAKLDALTTPPPPAPVVVAADYDGKAEDGLARFTAAFAVQAFAAGDFTLPLPDARLERVAVNGRPAVPTAAGGKDAVPLPGPGRHAVEVRFAVPVAAAGGEREVAFAAPEVPAARLTFAAPPAARQLQAAGRFGEQKTPTLARLDADLGGVKAVAVRWREGPGGAAKLAVREGCVWDVSAAGAVLTACYDIRPEAGAAAAYRFDLPPGLEPVRVAARGLDPTAAAVAVQSWTVGAEKGGVRALRVELAAPADGRVLVTVECHPAGPPTRQPVLRFPRPVGMDRRGGVYGLRAAGVTVEPVGRSGVIDFAPDALVREFGAVPDLRLTPGGVVQAFSPRPGESPELRPTLRPTADAATTSETTWAADLRGAAGTGVVRWAGEPAALREFVVAAKVLEVRGADVAGWAQAGDRVQVWFRRPAKDAAVEWAAAATHDPAGKPLDATPFEPPVPRAGAAVLRLRVADGVGVKVERDAGWAADPPGPRREWAFRSAGPAQPVRVQLAASRAGPATGIGLLDRSARVPTYRVAVELPAAAGRPVHAVVRVAELPPGAAAVLEPPAGARAVRRSADAEEWDIDAVGPVRAAVGLRLPAGWTGPLPAVGITAGGSRDSGDAVRFLGRIGPADGRLTGVAPVTTIGRATAGAVWPGEVERIRRTGGELLAVGGPVELVPPAAPPAPAPAPRPAAVADSPAALTAGPPPGLAAAAGWAVAVAGVGFLFARLPRATWPEQAAALAALFGHAVAGGAVVGLVVLGATRSLWLVDVVRRRA
jgi:hypothetical protein